MAVNIFSFGPKLGVLEQGQPVSFALGKPTKTVISGSVSPFYIQFYGRQGEDGNCTPSSNNMNGIRNKKESK